MEETGLCQSLLCKGGIALTGKTHKAIGMVTGVAMAVYAIKVDNAVYALGTLPAVAGSMLPDADHDMSKLGAQRKMVVKWLRVASLAALILTTVAMILVATILSDFMDVLKYLAVVIPATVGFLIATSQGFKKRFKFFAKHRGIMHTLIIPAIMTASAFSIQNEYVKAVAVGLSLGYVSHLVADCCTTMGCPVSWPVSQEEVSLLPIRTGTMWEYIVGALLGAAILFLGITAPEHPQNLLCLVDVLILAVCQGIICRLQTMRIPNKIVAIVAIVLFVIAAIVMVTSKELYIQVGAIAAIIGLFKGLKRVTKKKK